MAEKCFEAKVRVTPRSSQTKVEWDGENGLKVKVSSPPANGEANEAVIEALSKAFRTPKTSIEIVRGSSSRDKVIRFNVLTEDEAHARLP